MLRPLSPTLFDLPSMVQEKYRTCQTMCFCGLLPGIRRAWASIDNSLFLWRYDKSGDVPVEYCGEEQAICAVGLVRPRPGVFLEAIQHIIVLCTTTEIVLLGVCPTRRHALASRDGSDDIALQPLPMYTVPSDNVIMTSVATTAAGRIFLGGADGHLYELQYNAADGWGRKRCQKVRLTGRLQQLLPSFLPSIFGLGAASAVHKVVVDDERHILYVLSQPHATIQVFDLGHEGTDPAKKVSELSDFYQAAASATGGRDTFRNPASDKKAAAIKHITPIARSESSKLHLLVVTADGRRVYFTTRYMRSAYFSQYTQTGAVGQAASQGRPETLVAVFARQALPHTGLALGRTTADLARPTPLEVVCAFSSAGNLLLSEATGSDGRTTKLLLSSRNHTLPLAALNVGTMGGSTPGLREMLTELDNFVPGEACAIASSPQPSALGPEVQTAGAQEELIAQLFLPASRYVLISTAGVVELEKRRPIDVLVRVLEERHPDRVRQFFEAYGAPEAAAMCINIASSRPGTYPVDAVREAIAALEEPALVGEPRMPEDALLGGLAGDVGGVRGSVANGGLAGGGIYMGQAVNPNPEPNWSSAHRGLCLYLTRLLAPVWDMHITTTAAPTKAKGADAGGGVLHCSFSARTMAALIERLHCLDMFLTDFINRRQQQGYSARYSPKQGSSISFGGGYAPTAGGLFGPAYQEDMQNGGMAVAQQAAKRQRLNHAAQLEDERTSRTRALAAKAREALTLLQLLASNNLGRLAARIDQGAQRMLKSMNLRDLVYDADGETVAAKLISVLITQQLDNAAASAGGTAAALGGAVSGVEEVAVMLQKNCPSYFKEDDRAFYQASAKLKAAEAAPNASTRAALVSDALATLSRVPLACNLEYLVSQLAYLRCYEGIVDVPLRAAAAADPIGAALRPEAGAAHEEAKQRRRAAYQHIFSTLRMLVSGEGNPGAAAGSGPDAQKGLTSQERASFKSALLKAAFKSGDVFFLECLYDAMIAMGDATTLLSSDPPHLERFLAEHSGLATATGYGSSVVYLPNNGAPVGPLSRRQVQLAELLAKLHIGKRRFQEAASVYAALASRRSGPGESSVGLEERVSALQAAVLQAKSVGNSGLVDKLEADARLMSYQAQVAQRLEARRVSLGPESEEEASELGRQASDLATGLRDVSELYNDYAQPHKMWDVCLQLIDFAGSAVDAALVRQLWDHALLAAADHPESAIMGDSTSQLPSALSPPLGRGAGAGLTVRMSAVAALVERLGSQFFPSEASFPATHVAFRMEQVAAGLWPTAHAAATTAADGYKGDAMARAILGACHNSLPAALRVYELLLARRAPGVPEAELAQVRLKVSLLRSLAHLCRAAQAEVVSALVAPGLPAADGLALATGMGPGRAAGPQAALTLAHREAGNLADACERYALEARRLGDAEAEELAGVFDAVKAAAR